MSPFPNPAALQTEELPETDEQIFNWVAVAIAFGTGVFCGLLVGHIFTSHYRSHGSWSKETQNHHE